MILVIHSSKKSELNIIGIVTNMGHIYDLIYTKIWIMSS